MACTPGGWILKGAFMAERLIRVQAQKNLEYHPKNRPDLTKLYHGPVKGMKGEIIREGEIFEVEESSFDDYDNIRKAASGGRVIRGSMKRLDAKPEAQADPSLNLVQEPVLVGEKRGPGRPKKIQGQEI
jgi:hypothetical protein